jgi:H+/Cl- antiporter ClcA
MASIPVSPDLDIVSEQAAESDLGDLRTPPEHVPVDDRTVLITALAIVIALGASLAAEVLTHLIGLATNVAFYGRFDARLVSPGAGHLHPATILLIPILGALIVGLMARFGSAAIRGHGIPEVMERVLLGESRIPARVLFLKPLSAAVAIGTGGPFGAEGPIIATGGAMGSLFGQLLHVTADERKVLLASGAAAAMAATFGSPVSAVLLAVELLLFEYRARSLIPVALAAALATAVRIAFHGTAPVFPILELKQPSGIALASYAVLGMIIGALAALITRFSYKVESFFEHWGERLHIHWMWWPLFGAIVVGAVGLVEPRTLGVGYENISSAISGTIAGRALIVLVVLKLLSWSIYLGSGTSGGTLAPLFTIGSGVGAWLGSLAATRVPSLGVSAGVAGLVGMAAIFAGASHAVLTSVVFAFETTRQPVGLLPLLAGCTASYLVSLFINRHSIMTEKLARRGVTVRTEYAMDYLSRVTVSTVGLRDVSMLSVDTSVHEAREWLRSGEPRAAHQGFPIVDEQGLLAGVLTRRDILAPSATATQRLADLIQRPPVVVFEHNTLREAADQMVIEQVGRLPVVSKEAPRRVVGILSRSDLLAAHAPRLREAREARRLRTLTSIARVG